MSRGQLTDMPLTSVLGPVGSQVILPSNSTGRCCSLLLRAAVGLLGAAVTAAAVTGIAPPPTKLPPSMAVASQLHFHSIPIQYHCPESGLFYLQEW